MNDLPLLDAIDIEILMHRDIHFGGNFEVMLEYYKGEHVGVMQDFDIQRIAQLAHIEKEAGSNLSEIILPESAHLEIEKAKQLYLDLREVYEQEAPNPNSLVISNLILSESEIPQEEIDEIVKRGKEIVPLLIDMINSEMFYNPLNPGYGRAPVFAAKALGLLQDDKAIFALFHAMGKESFFTDEAMIKAIKSFGGKSKAFLINALHKKPYSKDNDHAAICLLEFSDDPEVAHACLQSLEDTDAFKRPNLIAYLIFGCAALQEESERQKFRSIQKKQNPNSDLFKEMSIVCNNWN